MKSYLIFIYVFVCCFARHSLGDSYQLKGEECYLADKKRGECKSFDYCTTAVISIQKQVESQECSNEGDICCELDPGPDYEIETGKKSEETRDDAGDLDEETDKFFFSRLNKNNYYGRKNNENYISQNNNYYSKPGDRRQGLYYNGKNNDNRQQFWSYDDQRNSFVFPTQGPWSQNGYQNGNNYQGNWNHFGNQRQTTQRPTTSSYPNYWPHRPETATFRPLLPTYKPNLDLYRPPSPNSWNQKRMSERKCEEYFEQSIPVASGLPLVPDPRPIKNNLHRCVAPQKLIVGGQNTTPGEYPHMALIYFRNQGRNDVAPKCGGSLISDRYVLTAAHCIESGGRPVKVLLGVYDIETVNGEYDPGFYSVAQTIIHPDRKLPAKYHDIALLRLSERVKLTYKIRPACLYSKYSLPEEKVVAVGWGRTGFAERMSTVLLKVTLNVYSRDFCSEVYKNQGPKLPQQIIDSQICAGDVTGGKDTCQGDSGGPIELVRNESSCNHYVVGVTSFGKICGAKNTTGVYTRVYSYLDWIESIVWPQ